MSLFTAATLAAGRLVPGAEEIPFDDKGYSTLPPCLWGRDGEGGGLALSPRPRVPLNATLRSVCRQNSTIGHYGQMASWQMRGVFYYD